MASSGTYTAQMYAATHKPATVHVVNQEFYSSELFNNTYPVETAPTEPPGIKWAATKFNSGIRASAANERFIKMRDENVDRRPYAGQPYCPTNTFVTTGTLPVQGPNATLTSDTLLSYHSEAPVVQPEAPQVAARTMTLSQLLASR